MKITLPTVDQAPVPDLGISARKLAGQLRDLERRERELAQQSSELDAGLAIKRAELDEARAAVRLAAVQEADALAAEATGRSTAVKDLPATQRRLASARERERSLAAALEILEGRLIELRTAHETVEAERAALHRAEREHAIASQIDAIGRPMIEAWKTLVEGFMALSPLDTEAAQLGVAGVNPNFLQAEGTMRTARSGSYAQPRPTIFVIRAEQARPLRGNEPGSAIR